MLNEIVPGVWEWDSKDITRYRSFALAGDGDVVLIDPLKIDSAEEQQLRDLGTVRAVLLTCAWHERDAQATAARFGCKVYAHVDAIPRLERPGAEPFPAELPLDIVPLEASGSSPGQVVFYLPRDGGAFIAGDFWHNLNFRQMPFWMRPILKYAIKLRDGLHLFPPVKASDPAGMVAAGKQMLRDRDCERLFVCHGQHLLSGAKEKLLARLEQGP